jgi:protein TonB
MNAPVMCAEKRAEVYDVEEQDAPNHLFTMVEEMPEYLGGQSAMEAFIEMNLVYPERAKINGISGTVYIQFTVKADGSITDVKVVLGIGGGCDEEAVRVVKLMNHKWKPGKENGRAVSTQMNLPVKFKFK